MKVCKASYVDDGVLISGIFVKRFFRKPVFYAVDPYCGWDSQVINNKSEECKIIINATPVPNYEELKDAERR